MTAAGTSLSLNGQPWSFTGYNSYQLPSVANGYQCGGTVSDQAVGAILDEMQRSSGSAAVRTWFFQSYGGPGHWQQFDRVLNAAAARGIKVIPTLGNEWGDCEPSGTYKGRGWYEDGYRTAGDGYALSYRDYAVAMAAHYAGNPTIAFWQLMNEAEAKDSPYGACDNNSGASALRSFADDVAGGMKAVDRNHLINLGTMGGGQCGTQGSAYQYIHAGSNIDICEIHDYWQGALGGQQWNGAVSSINFCHALGKPIFAGEVGVDASVQADWTSSGVVSVASRQQRAAFFQQKMTAQFQLGSVGFLIWSTTLGPSAGFDVGPGDPTEAAMAATQRRVMPAGNAPQAPPADAPQVAAVNPPQVAPVNPPQVAPASPLDLGASVHLAQLGNGSAVSAISMSSHRIAAAQPSGHGFTNPMTWSTNLFYGTRETVFADLSGKGKPASAVAVNDNSVWVELNTGSGALSFPQIWSSGLFYGSRGTYLADIDGSGRASMVAINDDSIWVELNQGNHFGSPQLWSSGAFYGNRGTYMAIVDGSGRASAVAVNGDSVWVLPNAGGYFGRPAQWTSTPFYGSRATVLADLDGSGRCSLVAMNDSSIWVEANLGSGGGFSSPQLWASVPFHADSEYMADVDGSGRASAVVASSSAIWVETNTGGSFGYPTQFYAAGS
ncbi:MAG: cellulase family glycosylhydrolase [Candidatus Dormibacteraeota bacterium]|uniref:mannan endo-1,4-beta-mannosidase n=1 Tax=Candidatus Amunia macphersoniae TaxID=3127014 RepID=A0A934KKK2_9BACT|nr:cellulase family glycosylhydrolase [Candidatus Dormibacteraeota bacterium]